MSIAVADPCGAPFTAPLAGSSPSAGAASGSGLSAEAPAGVLRTSPGGGGEKSSGTKRGVLGRMSSSVNFGSQTSSTHLFRALSSHTSSLRPFSRCTVQFTRAAILVDLIALCVRDREMMSRGVLPARDSRIESAMRLQENACDEISRNAMRALLKMYNQNAWFSTNNVTFSPPTPWRGSCLTRGSAPYLTSALGLIHYS